MCKSIVPQMVLQITIYTFHEMENNAKILFSIVLTTIFAPSNFTMITFIGTTFTK